MTPPSLLLLVHALTVPRVPIDLDEAVAADDVSLTGNWMDLKPASANAALIESRHRSLSGVGPEIPLPLYYSSPDSVLAVGAEGQLEHVRPEELSAGQLTMMKSMTDKYFDGSGHIPMKTVMGMCRSWYESGDPLADCVSTMSQMTPLKMAGFRRLLMGATDDDATEDGDNKPMVDRPDQLNHLQFLDRGKAFLHGDPEDASAQCSVMTPDRRQLCIEVLQNSKQTQGAMGAGMSCPHMEIEGEGFSTSHYAYALDSLTPFFTRQKNFHYFTDEKELRTKYETVPTRHGCGVQAKSAFERGDLIGLAGVAHATYIDGLMLALQETPWLGTNLNHCPEKPAMTLQAQVSQDHANAVIKLVEEDHKPTALWIYASEPIPAHTEITIDYNAAAAKFPNFISGTPHEASWACTKKSATRELRVDGPH